MQYYQSYSSGGDHFLVGGGGYIVPVMIDLIFLGTLIALKGYALWHAAKRDEKAWFIALLVINTMGILELAYLAFIVKKWSNSKTFETTTVTPIKSDN